MENCILTPTLVQFTGNILDWCSGASSKGVWPFNTTYTNVQLGVHSIRKEYGTNGVLRANMLRFMLQRATVYPHVLKTRNPANNVSKYNHDIPPVMVAYKAALRAAIAVSTTSKRKAIRTRRSVS